MSAAHIIALFHQFILPIVQAADEYDVEAGEGNPFLFFLLIIALVAFCLLVAAGIIVGLLALAALTGIGVAGIAANAVISGLLAKSTRVGFTVLILQFGGAIGLVFGIAACLAVRWLLGYAPFEMVSVVSSGLFSAALGAGLSWVVYRILLTCSVLIKERFFPSRAPGDQKQLPADSQVSAGVSGLPFR
jgi:MFS family permease